MSSVRNLLSRRELLKLGAAGVAGFSQCSWFEAMAQDIATNPQRRRSCILLWLEGGPATIDMFDLKPGNRNGGPYREIPTSVPGVRLSEHMPKLARNMHDVAVIRSMTTREGEHGRANILMRTGFPPGTPIRYPSIGALVSKELANDETPLPNFVALFPAGPQESHGSGFLGPRYAPLIVQGGNQQPVQNDAGYGLTARIPNIDPPSGLTQAQVDPRIDLLMDMERDFASRYPGLAPSSHASAYDRAVRLMRSAASSAFNLEDESTGVREQYGRNRFGQGCLLARRLVERGVPFVEVTLNGWDTHQQNFTAVQNLSNILDTGWGALMEDLRDRGLLSSTMIICMGEFGRTPRINGQSGRDHWPNSFSVVLSGGGIRGGQAYGQTSPDGMMVESQPTNPKSMMATVWRGLGVDFTRLNMSNVGRPIRLADVGAVPIADIVGS